MVVPVLLVHLENQRLPDLARKVEVDVRNRPQGIVQETAQEEVRLHRVHVGEANEVADDGRHRRASPPPGGKPRRGPGGAAPDPQRHLLGQLHDVAVDQEEPPEPMPLHQAELFPQPPLGLGPAGAGPGPGASIHCGAVHRVAAFHGAPRHFRQDLHGASPLAPLEVRKAVAQVGGEVEGAAPLGDAKGVRHRIAPGCEAGPHFVGRRQVEAPVGATDPLGGVQRRAVANGHQDVLQRGPVRAMVVDIPRGHHGDPEPVGQPPQGPVAGGIALDPVVLEFDEEAVRPEGADEAPGEGLARGHGIGQGMNQGTPTAPGEKEEAFGSGGDPPVGGAQEKVQGEGGVSPMRRGVIVARREAVSLGDQAAEVGVAGRGLGQECQVETARGLIGAGRGPGRGPNLEGGFAGKSASMYGEFHARDGPEPGLPGRPGKLHAPVEAVVIGEGQGAVAQFCGAEHHLFGVGGSVQEGVPRVGVELDIGGGHDTEDKPKAPVRPPGAGLTASCVPGARSRTARLPSTRSGRCLRWAARPLPSACDPHASGSRS